MDQVSCMLIVANPLSTDTTAKFPLTLHTVFLF